MLRKTFTSLLFTLVFVLVVVFCNGQARAQCDTALVPSVQFIPTLDGTIKLTIDPCTSRIIEVAFCPPDETPYDDCITSDWHEGLWCIDRTPDVTGDPDWCRPWTTVLDTLANRGAYSNCSYYVLKRYGHCP